MSMEAITYILHLFVPTGPALITVIFLVPGGANAFSCFLRARDRGGGRPPGRRFSIDLVCRDADGEIVRDLLCATPYYQIFASRKPVKDISGMPADGEDVLEVVNIADVARVEPSEISAAKVADEEDHRRTPEWVEQSLVALFQFVLHGTEAIRPAHRVTGTTDRARLLGESLSNAATGGADAPGGHGIFEGKASPPVIVSARRLRDTMCRSVSMSPRYRGTSGSERTGRPMGSRERAMSRT